MTLPRQTPKPSKNLYTVRLIKLLGSDVSNSEDDEDSESDRSDFGASPVRSGPSKKTGVETHHEQPGLLGYRMVCESAENETTERGQFKPYVRADIKTRLKPIDTSKHKAAAREALTLARSIDHLVRAIIFAQEEGAQFDFSRRHPFVELWRSLDVQCQRLSALMIVLKAQAEDAKCDVAGMWDVVGPAASQVVVVVVCLSHTHTRTHAHTHT